MEIKGVLHIGRSGDEPGLRKCGQLSDLSQARVVVNGGVRGAQGTTRRLRFYTHNFTHDEGVKQ